MKALIADQKLVTELLPMDEAIGVMRTALTMLAGGDVVMPLRQMIPLPGGDRVLGLMPSYLGAWVSPGAHINAVGAYTPATRELDTALVAGARLYADRRESLLSEAGEFLIPKGEGLIGDEHLVGEIGEVLLGTAPGRTSPDEITLFKSLGIAIEDLAAAHHVYTKARDRELGAWIDIGGRHFGSAAED